MKLLGVGAWTLLACCSALWFSSSSEEAAPRPRRPRRPAACDSTLVFSSEMPSLSEGNGNIHLTSLSPWSWRSTTVKNQIPSTVWEVKCTSTFCSSPYLEQANNRDLNSVPVYQDILVLNRKNGSHCYTASYRSVAVGCTCVWAEQN